MSLDTYEARVDAVSNPLKRWMKRIFFPSLIISFALFYLGYRVATVEKDIEKSSLLILMGIGLLATGAVVSTTLWIILVVRVHRVPLIAPDSDDDLA